MTPRAGHGPIGGLSIERSQPGDAGDEAVVAARGEVDLSSGAELREALRSAADSGCEVVTADLAEVTFLDSSGLAVLVSAHKEMTAAGQQLIVRGSSEPLLRLFRIAGLDEYLHLEH